MLGKAGDLGLCRVEFDEEFDAGVRVAGQEHVGRVHGFDARLPGGVVGGGHQGQAVAVIEEPGRRLREVGGFEGEAGALVPGFGWGW